MTRTVRAQARRRTRGRRRGAVAAAASSAAAFVLPRRRRWPWLAALLVLLLLIIADQRGLLLAPAGNDFATYNGARAVVARVIDGDTLELALPDSAERALSTRIRLWGIDAPEPARSGSAPERGAHQALQRARRLVEGGIIRLALEPHRTRDRYGRVLAHVHMLDGRSLNDALLEAGLARADDRWAHSLSGHYQKLEIAARRRGAGLWAASASPTAGNE